MIFGPWIILGYLNWLCNSDLLIVEWSSFWSTCTTMCSKHFHFPSHSNILRLGPFGCWIIQPHLVCSRNSSPCTFSHRKSRCHQILVSNFTLSDRIIFGWKTLLIFSEFKFIPDEKIFSKREKLKTNWVFLQGSNLRSRRGITDQGFEEQTKD